jgi:nucleotide-binding universal stress UspA family protein
MVEPIAEPMPEPVDGPRTDAADAADAARMDATDATRMDAADEPAIAPTSESSMRHGRIVVGVDGSEPSLKALRWAGHQAALTGAGLEAVMAWEMPGAYGWAGLPGLPSDFDLDEPAARALSDAVEAALPPGQAATATRTVVMGNPAEAILDRGDGADLIVVGFRGHGTFRSTLLGSVSHSVTLHASCPVVVVRGKSERPDSVQRLSTGSEDPLTRGTRGRA